MRAREPLHFGLTPWDFSATISVERMVAQARRAEALGFDSLWLPEHHFGGDSSNPAPLLLLAALAAVTTRLRLATTSLLLPVRHPLHVAAEVAVLDQLSGGRVILGLGRGFQPEMFEAFDVPTREKRDRFESALALIVDAWAGKPVTPSGGRPNGAGDTHARGDALQPVTLAPLPRQQPHPPLWVAAFGPKALAQAGRLGLPYIASPIEPLERLEANYAAHREELAAAGHSTDLPVPVMRTVFVHRDPTVCARVHAGLARQAAELARSSSAAIRRAGAATAEDVDRWALIGDADRVAERIERYRARIGVTHLIARVGVPGASPEEVDAALGGLSALRERLDEGAPAPAR